MAESNPLKYPISHHYDTLLDSITDGVFSVDLNFRITSFNRAAEEITGIPREEAIGQICCEVFRASICEHDCSMKKTLETEEPIIDQPVEIIDADGEIIPISISTGILRDKDGTIVGGVETFRDLSHVEALKKELESRYSFGDIISRNKKMQDIFSILPQVAQSGSTVLISGESGTGKELVARAVHNLSNRKDQPFVAINCGALPDTLLESELFGYKKGAFTDARHDKPGRFHRASDGTLFLDEIGDISMALQVKLLRVLEEKTFEPLGALEPETSDARIIAATNRNMQQMVNDGRFREDLYYRINVIEVHIPPLRERMEDIPLLVDHFIGHYNRIRDRHVTGISNAAITALMKYDFPGNIRELQNFIERAFVLCRSEMIQLAHLPDRVRPSNIMPVESGTTLAEMERALIVNALKRYGGNREKAAKELGVHRSTLYRKIRHYDINIHEVKNADY